MENSYLKAHVIVTAIILIVACCVMTGTVLNRVDKFGGKITSENYADFMQVECRLGSGSGYGTTMNYKYYVSVRAKANYKLENVTITYSLKSNGANLPGGILYVDLDANGYYSKEFQGKFDLSNNEDYVLGMVIPTLEISVISVSGTYKYGN